jgi:hypothetical protein
VICAFGLDAGLRRGFFDQAANVGFYGVAVAETDGGYADGAGTLNVIGHGQIVAAAVVFLDLLVAVEHRIVQARPLREVGDLGQVFGIVAVDAEDGESLLRIFLLEGDEPGHLHAAGGAPGGPKVDEQGFAAVVAERDAMAGEVAKHEGWCGLVEKRRGYGACQLRCGGLCGDRWLRLRCVGLREAMLVAGPEDEREAAEDKTEYENATGHQWKATMASPVSLSRDANARWGIC